MQYIYDNELEKLVGRFKKLFRSLGYKYAFAFDIQLSKLHVYVESSDSKVEDVIFTHTADIEDIEERLQNITKKVLF